MCVHTRVQEPAKKTKSVHVTSAPVGRILTGPDFMAYVQEHEEDTEMKEQEKIDKATVKVQKKIERERTNEENEKKKKEKVILMAQKKATNEKNKKDKNEEKKRKREVQTRIQEENQKIKKRKGEAKKKLAKEKKESKGRKEKEKVMRDKHEKEERELKAKQKNPCCGRKGGDMVGCDAGDVCPNGGWMHLKCAGLSKVPDGDWYCSDCT